MTKLFVTVKEACEILGRKRKTIWRLTKAGTLKKAGNGRGTHIEVESIEKLLADWKGKPVPSRAKQTVREMKTQERLKRTIDRLLLEKVNPETGIERTPDNPYGDPRLEPVVFDGIVMSKAEADAIQHYRDFVARARRLGGRLMAGI